MLIRISTHLAVILLSGYFLLRHMETVLGNSGLFLLVFLPYIVINVLDIVFLTLSLKKKPVRSDHNFVSVAVSTLVALHPVFVMPFPLATKVAFLKQAGVSLQYAASFIIVWALITLRANLTILPEANSVVKRGPYHFIRHPLYFSYILLAAGESLIYQSLHVTGLALVQTALIMVRAKKEETVLMELPEYPDYCRNTFWFVLPGSGKRDRIRIAE